MKEGYGEVLRSSIVKERCCREVVVKECCEEALW